MHPLDRAAERGKGEVAVGNNKPRSKSAALAGFVELAMANHPGGRKNIFKNPLTFLSQSAIL